MWPTCPDSRSWAPRAASASPVCLGTGCSWTCRYEALECAGSQASLCCCHCAQNLQHVKCVLEAACHIACCYSCQPLALRSWNRVKRRHGGGGQEPHVVGLHLLGFPPPSHRRQKDSECTQAVFLLTATEPCTLEAAQTCSLWH